MANLISASSASAVVRVDPQTLSQNHLKIQDDGNGGLMMNGVKIDGASVDYRTGDIHLPKAAFSGQVLSQSYQSFSLQQGGKPYSAVSGSETMQAMEVLAPREAQLSFISAPDTRLIDETIQNGSLTFDLLSDLAYPRAVILDSWVFDVGGKRIIERAGVLYETWDETTGTGKVVGSLNALSGVLTLTNISPNVQPIVKVLQGIYTQGEYQVKQFNARTALAPIKPQSLTVYAETGTETLQGKSQADEQISGSLKGKISYKTGFFTVESDKALPPDSLRYNAVAQSLIPLDSTIIGINAVRLPVDGRVPVFHKGSLIVISNKHLQDIGSAHSAGQTVQLERQNNDRICLIDADNTHINAELYDYDLEKGTITWNSPLDLSPYKMPITAACFWEEENRITDTDISGNIKLQFGVSRDYPIEKTYISSAVIPSTSESGNLLVHVTEPFSQKAWTAVWQDTRIDDPILARLNVKDYPIVLTSDGAITERWLIKFRSPSQFELYGEHLGLVAEGDTVSDLAPVNPATGKPYFRLPALAFGGGFNPQNCIRFNTRGTPMPVWILRAVQPSPNRQQKRDGFTMCLRGNTTIL